MRSRMMALLLVSALACGGDADAPLDTNDSSTESQASSSNQAPIIRSLRLVPAKPAVGDRITLNIRTSDVDADPVSIQVSWLRNGRSFSSGARTTLETAEFSRGDQVAAEVAISDGQHVVVQKSDPVTIENQAPVVSSIKLMPEEPHAGTPITAFAEASDSDRDKVDLSYQWFVNGRKLEDATTADLPSSKFRRGDKVNVEVTAHDGREAGEVGESVVLTIPNGPPAFDSDPATVKVYDSWYSYTVKASDPDNDRPLRYELIQGPSGMKMDMLSGLVTWKVPKSAKGSQEVILSVADPHGGRALQSYSVELKWDAPANADD